MSFSKKTAVVFFFPYIYQLMSKFENHNQQDYEEILKTLPQSHRELGPSIIHTLIMLMGGEREGDHCQGVAWRNRCFFTILVFKLPRIKLQRKILQAVSVLSTPDFPPRSTGQNIPP